MPEDVERAVAAALAARPLDTSAGAIIAWAELRAAVEAAVAAERQACADLAHSDAGAQLIRERILARGGGS